jgi:integral membrane protein (TIGR01906 family)
VSTAPNRRHALVALAATIVALGLSVSILLMPWFVFVAAPASGAPELTGFSEAGVREVAEQVRYFVTHRDAPPLPAIIDGQAGFGESSVSHLVDVRKVILSARWITLMATILLAVVAAEALSRGELRGVSGGLRTAGWSTAGLVVLMGIVGTANFDWFFSAFHGVFFKAGTWTFPSDEMMIRIFPESFWTLAAGSWAVLSFVMAAVLVIAGVVGKRVSKGMPGN